MEGTALSVPKKRRRVSLQGIADNAMEGIALSSLDVARDDPEPADVRAQRNVDALSGRPLEATSN